MKTIKSLIRNINWTKGLAGIAVMMTVFFTSTMYCLAAEGKIIADTAKIRAEANTDSEVVGSTVKGKTIDILDAVKDSAGTVWYKVSVTGGGYGYIRSDLVETSETIEASESQAQPAESEPAETTEEPEPTVPTAIGEQAAVIKSENNVRIRSGASTSHSTVTSLPNGTAITLIGEANDSAGNKWYQMTATYNNKNIEGYVRSDLIAIGTGGSGENGGGESEGGEGEGAEGEGENPEGEGGEGEGTEGEGSEGEGTESEGGGSEPVSENNDYEIVYRQDEAGEYTYYLYDNIKGTMQKVSDLNAVVETANSKIKELEDQAEMEKIIIIILAVVIVLLIVVITILLFKIRDLYYEDYDEEDEEEEEEPVPVRRKVRKPVVEEEPPVRKKKPQPSQNPAKSRPASGSQPQPKAKNGELRAAERKEPAAKTTARKSQNFLIDDDEFEFEFLNMDDKDL